MPGEETIAVREGLISRAQDLELAGAAQAGTEAEAIRSAARG
jgi:hypothetical protein